MYMKYCLFHSLINESNESIERKDSVGRCLHYVMFLYLDVKLITKYQTKVTTPFALELITHKNLNKKYSSNRIKK